MTDVELVVEADHRVGEGPTWHPDERRLYWVDIPTGRLFRYDPASDEHEQVLSADRALGGVTVQTDGSLACFLGHGGVAVWDGEALEYVIDELPGETDSRFNDVIADPEGRIFAGTMPTDDELGTLYRIDPDGSYAIADDSGYDIPNGMGFTPDGDALYVTESEERTIYRFPYDRETGALGEREVCARVAPDDGVPDGMTVDRDGDLWSARWGGHAAVRHDESGAVRERVEVPAPKVSAAAFGGEDGGDLYLTTAKGHDAEDEAPAGSLFRTRPEVGGRAPFRSRIGLD